MIESFTVIEKKRTSLSFWENLMKKQESPERYGVLDSLGTPEICRKQEIACRIVQKITDEIERRLRAGDISPDEATSLGHAYLAYTMEAILHNQDRIAVEMETDKIFSDNASSYDMETYRYVSDERLRAETALIGLNSGNYEGLKSYLLGFSTRDLNVLASLIPDGGQPLDMLPPAWTLPID